MGAILIGDADKVRGTNATIVGAPAASRRGRGIGTRLLGNTVDAPASATGTPVISVCSKGDVVCDLRGNPAGKAVEKHRGYGSGGGAAAVASAAATMWSRVAELGARLGHHRPRPAQPAVQPPARRRRRPRLRGRVVADQRSAHLGVPQPHRTAHRHRPGRGGEPHGQLRGPDHQPAVALLLRLLRPLRRQPGADGQLGWAVHLRGPLRHLPLLLGQRGVRPGRRRPDQGPDRPAGDRHARLGQRQRQRLDGLRHQPRPDAVVLGHEPPGPARHR